MNEKPIERLNYYNGQRLEARDLKLEQEYQMRVRRWLNKSLYTSGIAEGLTVRCGEEKSENGPIPVAIVSPGLALDFLGREIILVEEKSTPIPCGTRKYLTIRYAEETTAEEKKTCTIRSNSSNAPPWGGPARILADPVLEFIDYKTGYPAESSGRVVLCLMDDSMHAMFLDNSVRKYVNAAGTAKVHQYAIEGERHIDKDNPGRIHFHIRGRQPNAVTLYLKAEKFSTLFYTEMGHHSHGLTVGTMGVASPPLEIADCDHSHELSSQNLLLSEDGDHSRKHELMAYVTSGAGTSGQAFGVTGGSGVPLISPLGGSIWTLPPGENRPYHEVLSAVSDGEHTACITGGVHSHSNFIHPTEKDANNHPQKGRTEVTSSINKCYEHTHILNSDGVLGYEGVTDLQSRSGCSLTYAKNINVSIGKIDRSVDPSSPEAIKSCTLQILQQITDANSSEELFWTSIGDGKDSHPFAKWGTGPIRLDLLPYPFDEEGEYVIVLSVTGEGNGGRILYNLYVE